MPYAKNTKVPARQSRGEIEALLGKYSADKIGVVIEVGRAQIMWQAHNRTVRFVLPLPVGQGPKIEQELREKWRQLKLAIHGKLQSVESKIETFEEAFYAHIVTDDGTTVYERTKGVLMIGDQSKTLAEIE